MISNEQYELLVRTLVDIVLLLRANTKTLYGKNANQIFDWVYKNSDAMINMMLENGELNER